MGEGVGGGGAAHQTGVDGLFAKLLPWVTFWLLFQSHFFDWFLVSKWVPKGTQNEQKWGRTCVKNRPAIEKWEIPKIAYSTMDLIDFWGPEVPLLELLGLPVDYFFSSRNQCDFGLDFEPQNSSILTPLGSICGLHTWWFWTSLASLDARGAQDSF